MQLVHNHLKKLLSKYKILNKIFPLKKIGYFDGLHESGFLYGWAINPSELGKNQKLYFFINGDLVDTNWTGQDRPDVSEKTGMDGRTAGFYCALQSIEYFDRLKSGSILRIAFDEFANENLKGELLIDDSNIPKLLQGTMRLLASAKPDVHHYPIEKIFSNTALSDSIHWTDKAAIFLNHFLHQFINSEDSDFLSQVKNTAECWHLPSNLLEPQLIYALWYIKIDKLDRINLNYLEMAFLERFHQNDPKGNYETLRERCFSVLEIIHHYLLLIDVCSEKTALKLKAKIAFLFGKWTYKLGGPHELVLQFLDLVPQGEIEKFPTSMGLELLGRMQRAANRNTLAAKSFKAAIDKGQCSWFSYHEMSVLLYHYSESIGSFSDSILTNAITQFILASELNPSQRLSHREALAFLDICFDKLMDETKSMAEMGLVIEAISKRSKKLQLIRKLTNQLLSKDQIEASGITEKNWISKNNPKIMFLGSKNLYQCFNYRIIQKMEMCKALNLEYDFIDTNDLRSINWREALIGVGLLYLCRTACTNAERILVSYAKALCIPIVYDIDDLIFDEKHFPSSLKTYANTINKSQHLQLSLDCPLFAESLASADYVTVSTKTLAEHVHKFIAPDIPVIVLPNLLGNSLESFIKNHTDNSLKKRIIPARQKNTRIKIFYGSGTKAHKQVFYEKFLPAVLEIIKEFMHVDLHLMGYFEGFPEHLVKSGRIIVRDPTENFHDYLAILQEMDINIAILEESLVTDAKSEIKWLEAAAFAIPSIVSPTATYREFLVDRETVVFAKTPADWKNAMSLLITDSLARGNIGKNAQALALQKFSITNGIEILNTLFKTVGLIPSQKRKKRLLFCNVYFAPQSNGGATRVVETQVRGLLKSYYDEYEIYVLTTSEFTSSRSRNMNVEQYWYSNCLVTRLSLPLNDWVRAEDERVFKFCKHFFSVYQFDLIHMHSMQVLTASVGLAAKKLQIPYIITLHDAWWLSKYMFLIDEFGNEVNSANPLSGGSSKTSGEIKILLERDQVLRSILKDAKALLAVSQKFADLYTKAGVKNIEEHENIVEPFEVFERIPELDEKIVLGFIGGMYKHKGYHLFKQALEKGDFANFKALIIDHSLNDGEFYETTWGSTAVKFISKVKQREIGKLYSQFDVLVALSIWPESFGLVTREAINAGVYVLASDRGSIGDSIENNVNGKIISLNDKNSFINELKKLDVIKIKKIRTIHKSNNNQSNQIINYFKKIYKLYENLIDKK